VANLKYSLGEQGLARLLVLMGTFVCGSILLMVTHVRRDLRLNQAVDPHEGWVSLEQFFKDAENCTTLLKSRMPGESLLAKGMPAEFPRVGMEWQGSGQVIKEMYILRKEDEIAWQVPKHTSSTVYLKIEMVPNPMPGVKIGVDYMLHAPTTSRLIAIQVERAEEHFIGDCERRMAERTCYQTARAKGVSPKLLKGERLPASKQFNCGGKKAYGVQCLIPSKNAPIWKCE
jgi:hypothetical protein